MATQPSKTAVSKTGSRTSKPANAGKDDLWLNIFLSIFGISLFFSGIQSLGYNQGSAAVLGIVAALSGGVVLGLSLARLKARRAR